jgi:hypothetical protein
MILPNSASQVARIAGYQPAEISACNEQIPVLARGFRN